MAVYTSLYRGSTGDEVKKLQTALGIEADGKYGPQTENAVRQYQRNNGLSEDGIAGELTLGKLYREPVSVPVPEIPAVTVPEYAPHYDEEMSAIFDRLMNREKFSYDAGSDPLYRQYRELYTSQGRRAMEDGMGQAAALTGGYSSSYAGSVGQQQYDAYLQKLNAIVPELYSDAYDRYENEGAELQRQYSLMSDRDSRDYERYRDELSDHFSRADTEYERLAELMSSTGYSPTGAELSAAGMSPERAEAYRSYYSQQLSSSRSGSRSGSAKSKTNSDYIESVDAGLNKAQYDGLVRTIRTLMSHNGETGAQVSGGRLKALKLYDENKKYLTKEQSDSIKQLLGNQ